VKPGVGELFCTPESGESRDREQESQRDSICLEIKSQEEERLLVGIGASMDIAGPVYGRVSWTWSVKKGCQIPQDEAGFSAGYAMAPSQTQGRLKLKHGRRIKQLRNGPVKVGEGDIVNTRLYLYKSQWKNEMKTSKNKNTDKVLKNRNV